MNGDAGARQDAVERTDRNVVLRASAGTGKTTVLVDRLLHLLLRDGIEPERVVAITFTEMAAAEMKIRLRRKLHDAWKWGAGEPVKRGPGESIEALGRDRVARGAREALDRLGTAAIETMHAFAARLLRMFPGESGVDPAFAVAEPVEMKEAIERHWARWSRAEFAEGAPRLAEWRPVLDAVPWAAIQELAFAVADFADIPEEPAVLPGPARRWMEGLAADLKRILGVAAAAAKKKPLAAALDAQAALDVLQAVLAGRIPAGEPARSAATHAQGLGWTDADFAVYRRGRAAALAAGRTRPEAAACVRLLRGFADEFRGACLTAGRLSFDGLLALARSLATASSRAARRFQKHVFLVDEFQDTDERQAEIVLRLASPFTAPGIDWRTLVPRPGSVFVVGDPKQSIYAWRGADLGVYDSVCAQLVAGGALDLELTRNFRCQPGVVDAVNDVFGSAFVHEPGIQASPATLVAARPAKSLSGRIVTLRTAPDAGDAPSCARAEAAAVGNWIRDNRGKLRLEVEDGDAVVDKPMRFRDIAILLRQSTHLQDYLHALRERRIPYVVTREQFFYEAQEIRDAINLLLAVTRPDDSLSLAGVMRSPIGGLTFDEILAAGTPDTRNNPPGRAGELFALLRDLRSRALRLPVAEAVHLILDESGLRSAAAISAHGEQALSNLDKLASLAARWTAPDLSLSVFADRLGRRLLDVEREAESPLAEPDDEVVRISTIHAAKGLEWPVVILAGLHSPQRRSGTVGPLLRSAGGFAARAGDLTTPAWAWLADEARRREEAERVRLFYVACTRAREALVLSRCGPGNGAFLDLVPPGTFQEVEADASACGSAPQLRGLAHPSAEEKERWQLRQKEWERAMKTPAIDSPSGFMHREEEPPRARGHAWENRSAMDLGILVHRVLERWNFAGDDLDAALAHASADLPPRARGEVLPRARRMLTAFFASDAAGEIAAGTILGREIPFSMPLDGVRCIIGTIDLLFEKDGRLHIRDYKTGGESRKYETQESTYIEAVRRVVPDRATTFRFLWLGGEPARKPGAR